MILDLLEWLDRRRKPYSVAVVGMESGEQYGTFEFIRFRTIGEAQEWADLRNGRYGPDPLTNFVVVDLREAA